MSTGTYWDGKRYVKPEDFRRPPPTPKPPRKQPPKPQPTETEK